MEEAVRVQGTPESALGRAGSVELELDRRGRTKKYGRSLVKVPSGIQRVQGPNAGFDIAERE
ncbi:hypothetical protein T4D_4481 [Trichinella pseudospiralis]|uniref:Uncharacterized protein n=1 Tax=Trichinella pseudospiralis TaxID=6337 RepID=A0A0V1G5D8_TRIPS|nr:hypothetical protein T4D_4481 [Trichinella pseudospiralis]